MPVRSMETEEDREFWARVDAVAERDRLARVLLAEIHADLPTDMTGVVMVNADTGEWLNAPNKDEGWAEARKKWGAKIAHPPLWMITLVDGGPCGCGCHDASAGETVDHPVSCCDWAGMPRREAEQRARQRQPTR